MSDDEPDIEQVKRALVDFQAQLAGTTAALLRPPVRPMRILLDRRWMARVVQPSHAAGREVVRHLASAGVDEALAESKARSLVREAAELMWLPWDDPARANDAALDALTRFYVRGSADDELFAETRRAWAVLQSRRRKRERLAARARYRSAWRRWAAARDA